MWLLDAPIWNIYVMTHVFDGKKYGMIDLIRDALTKCSQHFCNLNLLKKLGTSTYI